jgi:hypothetical protein
MLEVGGGGGEGGGKGAGRQGTSMTRSTAVPIAGWESKIDPIEFDNQAGRTSQSDLQDPRAL